MGDIKKLQRDMMWAFENQQEIPTEVLQVAQDMFNRLEEKYEQLGCKSLEIKQYMQGNLEKLVVELQDGIGNRRKDEQFEGIQKFLAYEKQNKGEAAGKFEEISNNNSNNIRVTLNTIYKIEYALRDIQKMQNQILSQKRKFSGEQIEQINGEAHELISELRNKSENKVYNCFQIDNFQLRNELLQAYEDYKGE